MILPMIASIFLIIAIVCFLNLTPQQITQDLSSVVSKKPNIRDRARALRAGKKKKGLGAKLEYLQSALKACGKEGMFTLSLGVKNPDELDSTLANVMERIVDDIEYKSGFALLRTEEGIDLMPSNIELSGIEVRLVNEMSRERVLKSYIDTVKDKYDYCRFVL